MIFGVLGALVALRGALWSILRRFSLRVIKILGCSSRPGHLQGYGKPSGRAPRALWGSLGRLLGSFWEHFGGILGHVGADLGFCKASLKRFAEILKNHQKHYKVLQKSRFGGLGIHEKLSLEGKLEPNLELSLLIRTRFGAKIIRVRC